MNILFITAEGFDTPNPNNQMAEAMIKGFLDYGHKVHLIQSHRKGINPDIPEVLKKYSNFYCDTIVRNVVDKSNFIRRYLNDFRYAFQAKHYWKKEKNADVIYLQSNPTILYPMILLRLFKRKVPIVYSIYDVFPGHAHDIGVIRNKFVYDVLRIIQKPCYKMASAIVVLGEDMKTKVIEQGANPDSVNVVPAWFDVSTVREVSIEENRFIKKYNIPTDKFIVQFAGTVGYVFNYHTVISLAERLKKYTDIVIQVVGDGNAKDIFIAEAKSRNLSNITFYPLQPIELVSDVYSTCNLCIIPLQKGVIGNGIPSKAPILMACKRVIVNSVERDSHYAKMFADYDMGVAVDIEDTADLAEAIIQLKDHPEDIERMARNAYAFGNANYSSTLSIKKLLDIFEIVTKEKAK